MCYSRRGNDNMELINVKDFIKRIYDLSPEEVEWFDKNLIIGGIKNPRRPDLERGLVLYSICKKIKAECCLDIGTAAFFSAKSMAKSGSHVDTVDIKNLPFGGNSELMPLITTCVYDTKEFLPTLVKNKITYDLVFVDGDHSYAGTKSDILNAMKLSDLIVCHDYGNLGGPTKAIDETIKPQRIIVEDRMWYGAAYENGKDREGKPIDYGLAVWDRKGVLGKWWE
jgi:predicted O-methyltransferase YrrM